MKRFMLFGGGVYRFMQGYVCLKKCHSRHHFRKAHGIGSTTCGRMGWIHKNCLAWKRKKKTSGTKTRDVPTIAFSCCCLLSSLFSLFHVSLFLTMGKAQSKLSPEQLTDLQKCTYCKSIPSSYYSRTTISYWLHSQLTRRNCNNGKDIPFLFFFFFFFSFMSMV